MRLRINIPCNTCSDEWDSVQDIPDNQIFEFCCPAGHKNKIHLQNPRYELLFDMGLSAYKDGYYREACLDFAACIERFHEYCLYVMLEDKREEDKREFFQDTSIIENMWKLISAQSERQYGAFVVLYTKMFGQVPVNQTRKYIEFRNDVTHKGKFPDGNETIDYAKYVAKYIEEIYRELSSKIVLCIGSPLKTSITHQKVKDIDSAMVIPTFLFCICNQKQSFEQAMEIYNTFPLYI